EPGEVSRQRVLEVRAWLAGRHDDDPAQNRKGSLGYGVRGQRDEEQQTSDDDCAVAHDACRVGLDPVSGQGRTHETFALTSKSGVSDLLGAAMEAGRSAAETMMSRASVLLQLWMTPRTIVLGLLVVGLVSVLAFATTREISRTATPVTAPAPARPMRPALSQVEEAFIKALAPIHGDVQRSLMRASLGQILYKTNDLSGADLKTRMEQALVTYRRAETSIRALEPPASL